MTSRYCRFLASCIAAILTVSGLACAQDYPMKLGMNLFSIRHNSDNQLAFVDLMKGASEWMTQDPAGFSISTNTNQLSSIPLDSDGYPLQAPVTISGQQRTVYTAMVTSINGRYPAGNYVVLYDGTGTLSFAGSSVTTVGTTQLGPSSWRVEIKLVPDNTGLYLKIVSSSVTDHVRNIRVLMPGAESTYQTQPFNPTFLARIAPFTTLRFMEWNNMNTNTETAWGNRRQRTYYTQSASGSLDDRGIAYEHMIDLCNIAKKDCWVNVPTQADTTYITQMAALFRDRLDPSLKIYLEYSNECWNQTLSPTNYNWIETNSPSSLTHSQKTAYQFKKVFDIWAGAFGTAMAPRVVRVAAGNLSQNNQVVQDIMTWLNQNGGGTDAISVGPYFSFIQADYTTLNNLCPNVLVSDVVNVMSTRMPTYYSLLTDIGQKAKTFGKPLVFYEGGQSMIPSVNCTSGQNAIRDAQTDVAMYNFYQTWLAKSRDTGASLFMHFHLAGGGTFGSLSNIYDTPSQKYKALIDFIPPFTTTVSGPASALKLTINIQVSSAYIGQSGAIYIVAVIPGSPVYYSLTPNGWVAAGAATIPGYATGTLGTHTIPLLDGSYDVSAYAGTQIYAAYGKDLNDMLNNKLYALVYTLK